MNISTDKDLILFVDDEKICHSLVELIIPNFTKYRLISAFSGSEALMYAKRYGNNISLILSDIIMPDMNGFEIYSILSQNPNFENIPFIFQSGYSEQERDLLHYTESLKPKILYKPFFYVSINLLILG